MKTMKLALLGGAALAVMTAGAQADDLSALKAQIESLNARVAQMEAAPAVPAGYSLLTISEGTQQVIPGLEVLRKDALSTGNKATVIGILPTADAPATTEITWSGYARAALVYVSQNGPDDIDVYARGQIKVSGKTETAVGEVGATIEYRANFDGRRIMNVNDIYVEQAWGYWAMTPELTLGGGFAGSLGNIGYGYDGACNCYYTDNADVAFNPGDTSQMRLTYASGPFSASIALEDASSFNPIDADNGFLADTFDPFWGQGDSLGVAGEIKYSGDTVSGEISGVWRDGGDTRLATPGPLGLATGAFRPSDAWQVGMGLGFALGDMASLSLAGAMGGIVNGQEFWGVSALASMNLSDSVHAEIAGGYKNYNNQLNAGWDAAGAVNARLPDVTAVLAGIYYDPVSQLTIGLEGEYINPQGGNNNTLQIDLVTVFRF